MNETEYFWRKKVATLEKEIRIKNWMLFWVGVGVGVLVGVVL